MLAATLLVIGLLGWPLAVETVRALLARRVTMELLFILCLAGAFILSCQSMIRGHGPVYFEVVAVLLIVYSIGRAVSMASRQRAAAAMTEFSEAISFARRVAPTFGGGESTVPVREIARGDRIRVLPGEFVPVDGCVLDGQSFVRETPFTGEWISASRGPGDTVIAGTLCEDGPLLLEASTGGDGRRIDRLAELIDQARRSPTSLQRQADRFVRWFLPMVCVVALGTFGWWTFTTDLQTGLHHALAVLLVACPCAAGLATPLVLWTALGRLARQGLILRGGDTLERLAGVDSVIFDKTGTLGDERLLIERIDTDVAPPQRARSLAVLAAVERCSQHPVAVALSGIPVPEGAPRVSVHNVRPLPGRGIEADVSTDAANVFRDGDIRADIDSFSPAGNGRLHVRIVRDDSAEVATGRLAVRMEIDGQLAARVLIRERLRDRAEQCIEELRRLGLTVQIMTGDSEVGASGVRHLAPTTAGLTPEDKHQAVLELRTQATLAGSGPSSRPLFVGDGLNDAAAMGAAYAGIALAGGSAVAIESASATLHGGDLLLIPRAIVLARGSVRAIRSHMHWAVVYNIAGMVAAAGGLLHPITAALLMAASSAFVSWRSFRIKAHEDHASQAPPVPVSPCPLVSSSPHPLVSLSPHPPVPESPDPHVTPSPGHPVTRPLAPSLRLSFSPSTLAVVHATALLAQAILLAHLASLTPLLTSLTLLAFAATAWLALKNWHRFPPWLDMTFAMVTLGGLGMNFGWWADLGFKPVMAGGPICPCSGQTLYGPTTLLTWMNAGMLLLGVPAMFLARRTREPFVWRRWCCGGMIVLGVPGMIIGMMAGSVLAHQLTVNWSLPTRVVADYLLMMAGMCAGMLIPHALEYAVPARWRGVE
jgi:heavy metal translocating P-type ATPase